MDEKEFGSYVSKWINHNREILKKYEGEYVGLVFINDNIEVVSHSIDSTLVTKTALKYGSFYTTYFVPKNIYSIHVYPIRIKKVDVHFWEPNYKAELFHVLSEKPISVQMLVDSGADISIIPYQKGIELGFQLTPAEPLEDISGISGSIQAVKRVLKVKINEIALDIPVMWTINSEPGLILGRECVFDRFDIEFKQSDEEIIFRYRKDKQSIPTT